MGSNLKNPEQQLSAARNHIAAEIGEIIKASALYTTAAWGNTDQPDFLNQVIVISTKLKPELVLEHILLIEKSMGRKIFI